MSGDETGVLIVVNGRYGAALVAAAEEIVGPLNIGCLEISVDQDRGEVARLITREVERWRGSAGVLLLTDLCGSTIGNACLVQGCVQDRCEIVTGLNLPMLVKLATCDRALGAPAMSRELIATARRSIIAGAALVRNGENGGD